MSCPDVAIEPGQVWTDWLHEQTTTAGRLRPRCRQALVRWLSGRPGLERLRVKAVGAGHSTSGVARPRASAVFVDLSLLELEADEQAAAARWIRAGATRPGEHLVRVSAGTTIAALNRALAAAGRALPNMGSYDAQTVAGAVSTGTHGTGLVTGPLCDFVASIELVTVLPRRGAPTVTTLRIEPADGPTDPARFDGRPFGIELVQDSEAFDAAVVGLGCFGVVTAVTLRVADAFWLEETRRLWSWPELASGRTLLDLVEREPWVDLVVSPLPRTSDPRSHRVLVTTRRRIPVPPGAAPPPRRDVRVEKLRARAQEKGYFDEPDPRLALTQNLADLGSSHPRAANRRLCETLEEEAAAPPLRSASHVVLRTSVADWTYATSAEVAVPLERTVPAVEAAIEHLRAMHEDRYHHVSALGVRFGGASRHFLSQHHGRRTCTIEAPILVGARREGHVERDSEADIAHMLDAFVGRFLDGTPYLDARVHWGQRHLPAARLQRLYPAFDRWLAQRRRFDPYGIFGNEHTDAWTVPDPAQGTRFTPWQGLGGILTSAPVAARNEDGRIEVIARGTDEHLWRIAERAPGAGAWQGWAALDAGLGAQHRFGTSLSTGIVDGRLHVMAYYAAGQRIGYAAQAAPNGADWRWDLGSDFGQLVGGACDAVAVAEETRDGRRMLTVAALRTNGRVHVRTPEAGNGTDVGEAGRTLTGVPALVGQADGRLTLVARDAQGRVLRVDQDAQRRWGTRWEPVSAEGSVTGDVSAALGLDGCVHLFARGPRGDLVHAAQAAPNASAFGAWQPLGGPLAADARPAVVCDGWSGLLVFVRWEGGSVRCRRQRRDGSWGDWESLGGVATLDPCVVPAADGALVVLHVGRDQGLYWCRQSR